MDTSSAANENSATTISIELGGRSITMETGQIARQASAAVLVKEGATVLLVTVTGTTEPRPGVDFFPLTVEYREKFAAVGRIPGNFMRREGRISDHEVICSRLVDRSIRPLFPKGYQNEVQVQIQVLSADDASDPAPLAILGAGAALHLSPIPWSGPAGGIRICRIDDRLALLPNPTERKQAQADLMISTGPDGMVMVEGEAKVLPDDQILEMLFTAQDRLSPFLDKLREWRQVAGQEKWAFTPPTPDMELAARIAEQYTEKTITALAVPGKHARHHALEAVKAGLLADYAKADESEETAQTAAAALRRLTVAIVRGKTVKEKIRVDGRGPEEIRQINCQVGWLPSPHGSAIFTRGETQALVTCTLAGDKNSRMLEGLEGISYRKFMLHYNFPPYSVGETRPIRGPGRREIGHGTLALKALTGVFPGQDKFPYVVRVESDITESNGSSSMATVCGGSMALCNAGVPIKSPVAGIAMGLIQEDGETVVLSDILGDEDHLGDMDFKVTGTTTGVTALQMDNKIGGLSRAVMSRAMQQAQAGRLHILEQMALAIDGPRSAPPSHAPQSRSIRIREDNISLLIGARGKTIKGIQAESGAEVSVDDSGLVTIMCNDGNAAEKALAMVREAAGEVKKGRDYLATVVTVRDFGAFVRIYPHVEGLVHASEWDEEEPASMRSAATEGDKVMVRVRGADEKGRLVLSRRDALATDPADAAN